MCNLVLRGEASLLPGNGSEPSQHSTRIYDVGGCQSERSLDGDTHSPLRGNH